MPLTFCGHVLVTACAPVTALNCGMPAAVKIAAETEASFEIALERAAMEVPVDVAPPMVVLDETFTITADRAVSMLAASVLIAADTLAMSALITVESAVSADTASALIVAESAVLADAALEAALEIAGLDVAV